MKRLRWSRAGPACLGVLALVLLVTAIPSAAAEPIADPVVVRPYYFAGTIEATWESERPATDTEGLWVQRTTLTGVLSTPLEHPRVQRFADWQPISEFTLHTWTDDQTIYPHPVFGGCLTLLQEVLTSRQTIDTQIQVHSSIDGSSVSGSLPLPLFGYDWSSEGQSGANLTFTGTQTCPGGEPSVNTFPVFHGGLIPVCHSEGGSPGDAELPAATRQPDGTLLVQGSLSRSCEPGWPGYRPGTATLTYTVDLIGTPGQPPPGLDSDGDGIPDQMDPRPHSTDNRPTGSARCTRPQVDPVYCYAPEVRLAKGERYFPMDQAEFVRQSSLQWAHDAGCRDRRLAKRGSIDAGRLGSGGYTWHEAGDITCGPRDEQYRSDQATRPYQANKDNEEKAEGFFLNLRNSARRGTRPVAGAGVPLYYNYEPGRYVTYWFMYGYDDKGGGAKNQVFGHEGEWERITVRLNADDSARSVDYYQHNCSGEGYTWDQMVQRGYLVGRTHPTVYAAKGAHASYPTSTSIPMTGGSCPKESRGINKLQGAGDRATGGGAVWKTWQDLRDITTQPWYGFGGAWGEVVADSDSVLPAFRAVATGPMGPPHLDPDGP